MLSKKNLLALIILALLSALLVIFSGRYTAYRDATNSRGQIKAGDDLQETVIVGAGQPLSSTPAFTETQLALPEEGFSLIEARCSKCHVAQALPEYKKSRSDWDLTLTKMESFGVELSDSERVELLDFLGSAGQP